MALKLPEPYEHLLKPLFDVLPPTQAMSRLVVSPPLASPSASTWSSSSPPSPSPSSGAPAAPSPQAVAVIEKLLADPALAEQPALQAGLWLYADELDRSHRVSQKLDNATGAFWHGILHRREGDFANAHYWFTKAGKHPAIARIDLGGGGAGSGTTEGNYDPHDLVDRVEKAHRAGRNLASLVSLQRREWSALFAWCANRR